MRIGCLICVFQCGHAVVLPLCPKALGRLGCDCVHLAVLCLYYFRPLPVTFTLLSLLKELDG